MNCRHIYCAMGLAGLVLICCSRAGAETDPQIVARQLVDRGMYDLEYLYAATQRKLRIEAVAVEQNPEVRPTRINLLSCLVFDPLDIVRFKVSGAFGRYK